MGWQPEPRWDKACKRYRVQIRGARVWLGVDWGEALRRCGELLAESGMGHLRERPLFVSELVLAHRGTNPTAWQKYVTGEWVQFCGLTARLDELHYDAINDFKRHLEQERQLGPQTTRHMLSHAIRALKWGHQRGYLTSIPELPRLPAIPDDPKDISDTQLRACWKYFEPKRRQRARTLFDFMLITGMRPTESRLLKWVEIRFDTDPPHVCLPPNRHKTGRRTGKPRRVPLSPEALDVLDEARQRDPHHKHVFLTRLLKPYTKDGLYAVLKRAGVTPYQLRHTFGQNALEALKDMSIVGELLGHTDRQFRSVRTYARIKAARIAQVSQNLVSARQRLHASDPAAASSAADRTAPRKGDQPKTPRSDKRRSA